MFSKFAKIIRWSILFGMLYTLYVVITKDNTRFTNQTDEKVLVEIAKNTTKSMDEFLIYKQLCKLFPQNEKYKEKCFKIAKRQANKLLDSHEKMLLPLPSGNYKYIEKIEFGKDKNGKYVLIFNLSKVFNNMLDANTQKTVRNMLKITHHGMYQYYGFNENMRLLLVPTFDKKDDIEIIDLERIYEKKEKLNYIPPSKDN